MAYVSDEEKQFLKEQAVRMFNAQYGKNINPIACGIKSIPGNYECRLGYEIWTDDSDDFLRIRFYFDLLDSFSFAPYRLELDRFAINGNLGDEIYVAVGAMPMSLKDTGTYSFNWIDGTSDLENIITYLDGTPIQYLAGGYMTYLAGN